MKIEPGEIVGIPFPYTDMTTQKRRPVLVVTPPDQRGDFIGLAVTSVLTEEMAVRIDERSMANGNLPKTSWVRFDKVFTLSVSLIKKKYGSLQKSTFDKIIGNLCRYLGCA
ncbi:type II toxin-antitoxin system PemK/MazF family toxin [Methanosarcinales archaeon]|nr:MAG: type II toxin-antitoxin system PemK/MazF family toxin [Methanosarcinales archaeon]